MKLTLFSFLFFCLPFISVSADEFTTRSLSNTASPLVFIENKGQIDNSKIDFVLQTPGLTVFVEKGKLHYQWTKVNSTVPKLPDAVTVEAAGENEKNEVETYGMDVTLLGADIKAKVTADGEQEYYERYFNATMNGEQVHSYKKITYHNIYPGIDWVLYLKDGKLEYDLVVHPGGEVKDIRLQYDGALSLELVNGSLKAATPLGSVYERQPYSYLAADNSPVASSFRLQDNILGFDVAQHTGTLVIDPVIDWATYYGGTGAEIFYGLATDASGNLYAAGLCRSNGLASPGAFQDTLVTSTPQSQDAILVKFNAAGQRLWATYYGGAGNSDGFYAVACDPAGNVYAGGMTNSTAGIHTTGAHDTALGGVRDCMLVKFDAAGNRIWGTYYGGADNAETLYAMAFYNYNLYIGGHSNSLIGIASGPTVHKSTHTAGSGSSGFLARFDTAGVRQWGTYYGDSNTVFWSMTCDDAGNIYAAGATASSTGIHTKGAHDTALGYTGTNDGFVVKFNAAGVRQWGTYFGGNATDEIRSISKVKNGSIYITGHTFSDSSVATPGSFRDTMANTLNFDAFVAKMSIDSGKVRWSTYYGGYMNDYLTGVAAGTKDKIYLAGYTASSSLVTTPGSHRDTLIDGAIGSDAFFLVFDTMGNRRYSTYYGGKQVEVAFAVHADDSGNVYWTGYTGSPSDIVFDPAKSFQDTLGGIQDAFLVKFNEDRISISRAFPDSMLCPGTDIPLRFTTTSNFNAGNVFTAELSDTAGSFLQPVVLGTLSSVTDGVINCHIPYDTRGGQHYRIRIKASDPPQISTDFLTEVIIRQGPNKPNIFPVAPVCAGASISLYVAGTYPGSSFVWSGPRNFSSTLQSFVFSGVSVLDSGRYIITASQNGCDAKDSIDIKIYNKSDVVNATGSTPICDRGKLELSASSRFIPDVLYTWIGPNGFTDTSRNPVRNSVDASAAGIYTVAANLEACGSDTIGITVTPIPEVTAGSTSPVDSGDRLFLTAVGNHPDIEYRWTGPDGFESPFQNPEINNVKLSASGAYIVTASRNGCKSSDTTVVVVNSVATSRFEILPNPTAGDLIIRGSALNEQTIPVVIFNAYGQEVYRDEVKTANLVFNKTLRLAFLSNGVYMLQIRKDGQKHIHDFVLIQK